MASETEATTSDEEFTKKHPSLVPQTREKTVISKALRHNSAVVSERLKELCEQFDISSTPDAYSDEIAGATLPCSHYQYFISITPTVNFAENFKSTKILYSGKTYVFIGFIVVTKLDISKMPPLCFRQHGYQYSVVLKLLSQPVCLKEKEVVQFENYLFSSLLELFNFTHVLRKLKSRIFFIPSFTDEAGTEILPFSHVLQWLIDSRRPLLPYIKAELKQRTKRDINKICDGQIVTNSNMSPSSIRMDRLEWPRAEDNKDEPEIIHFTKANKPEDFAESTSLTHEEIFRISNKDVMLSISAHDFFLTGLYTDVVQHCQLLPLLTQHILHHDSLSQLEHQLHYTFQNKQLLERALTHPSYSHFDTILAEQGMTTALNCGLRKPRIRDRKKRMAPKNLRELMQRAKLPQQEVEMSVRYNEQLEFLGDAALEYICSLHLFHMLPEAKLGQLVLYRKTLIKNRHLAKVAQRLNLQKYILTREREDSDLPSTTTSSDHEAHMYADAIEALLGAVYIDSGLKSTQLLIARLFFPEEDIRSVWLTYPPHPIQMNYPTGDRHLIAQSHSLQKLVKLEESVGVHFTHISLLTKAFTHSSMGNSYLFGGSYEKLEHLGDAVLQFLVSEYLYHTYPTLTEGQFSMLRMALVQNKLLAELSKKLGFDQYIRIERYTKVDGKILADLFESYLAALLLDKGLEYCRKFLEVVLFPKLMDVGESKDLDPNTDLQRETAKICRQFKIDEWPVYRTLKSGNETDFTVGVYFMGQRLGTGSGPRVKDARHQAAKQALDSGILSQFYKRKCKSK